MPIRPGIRFALALLSILLSSNVAAAQTVKFANDSEVRTGVYTKLWIRADGPGLIQIRSPEATGIDWKAPRAGVINAPIMFWKIDPAGIEITVNGKPQKIAPLPTSSMTLPPDVLFGPRSADYSEDAYLPTIGWYPGMGETSRQYLILAGIATIFVMTAVRVALGKSKWLTPGLLIVGVGLAMFFGAHQEMLITVSEKHVSVVDEEKDLGDHWRYLTASSKKRLWAWVQTSTVKRLMLVPRSPAQLRELGPVVVIEERGNLNRLEYSVSPDCPAAILIRGDDASSGEGEFAPTMVQRLYRRNFVFDENKMKLNPLKPSESR